MAQKIMDGEDKEPGFMLAQDLLLKKLLSGNLKSGESLRESVLAKEFGTNRPSVREALCQAIGWGVVEYVPYCGYRVCDFTLGDMCDWYELREGIEPIAGRNLAETRPALALARLEAILDQEQQHFNTNNADGFRNSDLGFHMTIVSSCGNKRFSSPASLCYFSVLFRMTLTVHYDLSYQLFAGLARKNNGLGITDETFRRNSEKESIEMHREIFAAIKNSNGNQAEQLLRNHVNNQVHNTRLLIEFYGNRDISTADLVRRRRKMPDYLGEKLQDLAQNMIPV